MVPGSTSSAQREPARRGSSVYPAKKPITARQQRVPGQEADHAADAEES